MDTQESHTSFEQPRSTFGTWLGIVLLFCVFGLFVWVVMGLMPRGDSYEDKRSAARLEKLKTAREEYAKASGYGWVDKEKGVARIPVERAMELAATELAQRKPAAAGPIAPTTGDNVGQQVTAPAAPAPAASGTPQLQMSPKATAVTGKDSENRGQPAAAANPPDAAPGTQPGPQATAAASPPSGASRPQPGSGDPGPTPVQQAPGPNLPIPGKEALPPASAAPAKPPQQL